MESNIHSRKPSIGRWLGLMALIMLLPACSEPPPMEEAIARNIRTIQAALENKDRSGVLDRLTEDFTANRQLDKQAIGVMLLRHFIAHRKITVTLLSSEINPHPGYTFLAEGRHAVVLTGAEQLVPDTARVYQVSSLWKLQDGQWLLHELRWE